VSWLFYFLLRSRFFKGKVVFLESFIEFFKVGGGGLIVFFTETLIATNWYIYNLPWKFAPGLEQEECIFETTVKEW